jgi:hypothetical protein
VKSSAPNIAKVEEFLRKNPEVEKALDLFSISQRQYVRALEATLRPGVRVSNSTNE